ncbi:MAG: methyltransferase [Methylobacter sp.]|uniref:methyltransferase n=1 Tax=Methylobacter sp. TaxID=2051955 RepID=UPI00258B0039|nr:methyltransferase [Methylobacter sp.]MCL7419842.1 methyltransferase [Methylobacter sp.]
MARPGLDNLLTVPQGEFKLDRLPLRARELLRAWDAADEYLLDYLAEDGNLPAGARILILNDTFGALAVALSGFRPQAISDSYLSQQATRVNLAGNGLAEDSVRLLNSLEAPDGVFDAVLIKVPKTLALLEDQLLRLQPHLQASTRIIVGGMIKAMPASVWKILERLIGPTTTSLARKKARLIFAAPDPKRMVPANPYPVRYRLEGTDYLITNHANVFSRDSLDIGTRFFLQHLPVNPEVRDIVDLGCGNGVVGLMAAVRNPQATVHFVDESFMAVASARENFSRALGAERQAMFRVGDGLTEFEPDSVDLILCNPPFHQQHAVGDQIASSMFKHARRIMRTGGELWVIGNRHLGYHVALKRLFEACSVVAANSKFVILRARAKRH